ncbi:MAG: tetratricopeptide repeat protein [Phycisphaerales bacterium]
MVDMSAKIEQARQLAMAGRADQARAGLLRALQQHPGHPDLSNALSLVLGMLGQHELAAFHAERAVAGRPGDPGVLCNLANALAQAGKADRAKAAYERAIALDPRAPAPRLGISHVLRGALRFTEAAEHLRHGLVTAPDDPDLLVARALLLLKVARGEEAADAAKRAAAIAPNDLSAAAALAHISNYDPDADGPAILAAHRRYGALLEASTMVMPAPAGRAMDPERPIRVGLLSYDLRAHPVGVFIAPFLAHRDRGRTSVICYYTAPAEDAAAARLRAMADGWRAVGGLGDAAIAAQIRADEIDILIELSGLTATHRLGVMACAPAPLQATFLGYPSTTGLSRIGWRVVDRVTDPPGEDHATERLLRLDPPFLAYMGPEDAPEVSPPSAGASGHVTFGSFNSAPKINRGVVAAWAEVLRRTPGSRLLVKALEFGDPGLRSEFPERFEALGIDPGRVEVMTQTPGASQHLALYGRLDIALDTFPYNGTTTTCEALWMGVPVVAVRGRTHAGRVSESLLGAANECGGLPMAADSTEYVNAACALATDRERLARDRALCRERARSSVLCDGRGWARRFEAGLRAMWRQACAAEAENRLEGRGKAS